jgi:LPXTG-motif cell wall-anchored protein
MKNLRMFKTVCLSLIFVVALFMVTANAGEVEFSGKSSTPVFTMNGNNVYCAEPDATHPITGVDYEATNTEFHVLDEVFINDYIYTGEKNDLYQKVMQQVIWSKINPSTNYRMMTQVLLGENAVVIFDILNSAVNVDEYEVKYTLYISTENDEMGRPYQQLIDATVKTIEAPVSPEVEPEPTEPTPIEPEVTEPTPVEPEVTEPTPVEPEVTEPTPVKPESTEPTPVEPEVTEPTPVEPEPTEPETVPVLGGSAPVQNAPKTGDSTPVMLLLLIIVLSATALVLTTKKKKSLILGK